MSETITMRVDGYGTVTVPSYEVDRAMVRYLPASPMTLRAICQERSGLETGFQDVLDVTTFLVILADWDREDIAPGAQVHRVIFDALD